MPVGEKRWLTIRIVRKYEKVMKGIASLPSAEADGLESDLQRLQLFVLRKGEGGEEPLSEKGGEKEESEEPLGQRAVSVRVWAEDSPLLRAIAGV